MGVCVCVCSHIHVYELYVPRTVHCNIIMQCKPISWYILYNYITIHGAKKYTNFVGLYCIIMHVYIRTYINTSHTKLTVVKTMLLHNSITSLETGSTKWIVYPSRRVVVMK